MVIKGLTNCFGAFTDKYFLLDEHVLTPGCPFLFFSTTRRIRLRIGAVKSFKFDVLRMKDVDRQQLSIQLCHSDLIDAMAELLHFGMECLVQEIPRTLFGRNVQLFDELGVAVGVGLECFGETFRSRLNDFNADATHFFNHGRLCKCLVDFSV